MAACQNAARRCPRIGRAARRSGSVSGSFRHAAARSGGRTVEPSARWPMVRECSQGLPLRPGGRIAGILLGPGSRGHRRIAAHPWPDAAAVLGGRTRRTPSDSLSLPGDVLPGETPTAGADPAGSGSRMSLLGDAGRPVRQLEMPNPWTDIRRYRPETIECGLGRASMGSQMGRC
jgi:hypothetical protein